MPPTPSSLCGTLSASLGMMPARSLPVVSVRYLPTRPDELARPLGKRVDLELSSRRDVSHALAASTTTRARTSRSSPEALSMYATPDARPFASVSTSRTIALGSIASRPVVSAGPSRTPGEEKFEFVLQPRLHWPQ